MNSSQKEIIRRSFARLPLLGMVAGCFLGVFCAEKATGDSEYYWLLALPALISVWCRFWKSALFFAAWFFLYGLHVERLGVQGNLWASLERSDAGIVKMNGVITKRVDSNGFLPEAWLKVEGSVWRGARVGLKKIPPDLLPGDRVAVVGELSLPPPAQNPGEMDLRDWYRRVGLAGEMKVQHMRDSGTSAIRYMPARWSWRWREQIGDRLVWGMADDGDEALLLKALVLGDRSQGGETLFGAFRRTGTMHVFAVSGLHVGLVALLGWMLVRVSGLPRNWGLWFVIALIWTYAGVTGLRPPVVRAATMGTFVLLGFVLRRESSVGNALLASVPFVLLQDSYQWRQPGFQLSYVVVAVIILLASLVVRSMRSWIEEDPYLPRALYTRRQEIFMGLREKLGALLAVSGTAWLGSFPLMRWYFGVITPIAIPASMLLVPLVFVILALAFGGFLLGFIWPGGRLAVNSCNEVLIGKVHEGVQSLSHVPGGQWKFREHNWGRDGLLIFSLDDGGAAAHVDAAGGVMIDVASVRQFHRVVRPALRDGHFSPDSMVLTHPDGAHVGGALPAIEEWDIKQVLIPTDWARSPAYRALLEYTGEKKPRLVSARAGQLFSLEEGVSIEVISAPTGWEDRLADDRGLIVRLYWEGWKFLFTGDAGFVMEKPLLAKGVDVSADVLIMGRHGSDFSGLREFLQAVGPQVVLTSDSGYERNQRVSETWANKVRGLGIDLWLLSETGASEIKPYSDKLELRSYLQREETLTLRRR